MGEAETTREETGGKRAWARLRAVQFVLVFVCVTLALLTAYAYTSDTKANARYLGVVARHTTWALRIIGHGADLRIVNGEPRVAFVLTASPATKLRGAEEDLRTLRARGAAESAVAAMEEKTAALRTALAAVQAESGPVEARKDQRFGFIIVAECGAIEVMSIFFAAVLAFPAPLRKKLLGLLLGLPLLYCVNVLRLSCLGVVGAKYDLEVFEFCHRYVWQSVYIVFVVAVWMFWVEYIVKRRSA